MVGSPLPAMGVTHRRVVPPHLRGHDPSCIAPMGSCAPPPSSRGLRCPLPRVLAGCDASLRDDGGSRRYLCLSVQRGLEPSPGSVVGAPAPSFPPPSAFTQSSLFTSSHTPHTAFLAGVLYGVWS